MDRDINALSQDDGQVGLTWRSREIERQRTLELSGVLDAAQHPAHGQRASFRNTLAICLLALAAVAAMVTIGFLRQDSSFLEGTAAVVVPVSEDTTSASAAAEPSNEATNEVMENLALAAFQNTMATNLEEPSRANCDAIRGTPYLSETERTWFLATCVIEPEPVVFLAAPGISSLVPEPAPEPAPVEGLSAAAAISSAVGWIASQPHAAYVVSSGDCNTTGLGETWLVSCRSTLLGCDFEKCQTWHVVCVTDTNRAVLDVKNC